MSQSQTCRQQGCVQLHPLNKCKEIHCNQVKIRMGEVRKSQTLTADVFLVAVVCDVQYIVSIGTCVKTETFLSQDSAGYCLQLHKTTYSSAQSTESIVGPVIITELDIPYFKAGKQSDKQNY